VILINVPNICTDVRSEVFVMVKIHIKLFCVVTPCSDVVEYQCFGEPCCLHLQGILTQHSMVSQSRRQLKFIWMLAEVHSSWRTTFWMQMHQWLLSATILKISNFFLNLFWNYHIVIFSFKRQILHSIQVSIFQCLVNIV